MLPSHSPATRKSTLSSGDPDVPVDLDVTKAQSVRIDLTRPVQIGDPVLEFASRSPEPPSLLSPADGVVVSGPVRLEWSAVPGASSYGVEIVCTKPGGRGNARSPRIWVLNSSATHAVFNAAGAPDGEYRWSVIAFGAHSTLTKFSHDQSFALK